MIGKGRGRPRKPTALKILQGNPGRRPIGNEPKPTSGLPKCPSHLSAVAKAEWKRTGKELDRLGLMTKIDRAAFEAYCCCYANWRRAQEMLDKSGPLLVLGDKLQVNPAARLAEMALSQMYKFLTEFGLSPASRTRLHVPEVKKAQDEFDAYQKRRKSG